MTTANFINEQEIWALLDANRYLPRELIEAIIENAAQARVWNPGKRRP